MKLNDKCEYPVIVLDEHTLGIVYPNNNLQILHTSILRGSPWGSYNPYLIHFDPVLMAGRYRAATYQDFTDYRIANPEYYLG